jgi:hypothetical protein
MGREFSPLSKHAGYAAQLPLDAGILTIRARIVKTEIEASLC